MRLYSKIYGDSSNDLIIIHGLFGMSDNWNSLGKKFAEHFRVHLIDLRNHGRSPHSALFNYDVMCNDILEYLNENQIQRPILLGHSLGGKVAMKFAFTHPELIEKIIVADIAPRKYNTDFHENLLLKLSELELLDFSSRSDLEKKLSESIKDATVRSFLLKNLFRNENKEFAWRFNIKVLSNQLTNIQEDTFVKGYCDVPTHFIRGEKSNYVTDEDLKKIKKHFTQFTVATINDAGHWLHAENPEGFYNQVLASV